MCPSISSHNPSFASPHQGIRFHDLEMHRIIGTGQFGMVRLVRGRTNDAVYALKAMHKAPIVEGKQIEHVLNERRILQQADSSFCVQMVAAYQDERCLWSPRTDQPLHVLPAGIGCRRRCKEVLSGGSGKGALEAGCASSKSCTLGELLESPGAGADVAPSRIHAACQHAPGTLRAAGRAPFVSCPSCPSLPSRARPPDNPLPISFDYCFARCHCCPVLRPSPTLLPLLSRPDLPLPLLALPSAHDTLQPQPDTPGALPPPGCARPPLTPAPPPPAKPFILSPFFVFLSGVGPWRRALPPAGH
eukprot:352790-Chlamydomonas_euryale.AAC.1